MPKPLIAGNWKMNKTNSEAVEMVTQLKEKLNKNSDVDAMIAPPYTALSVVYDLVKDTRISLGAQNVHHEISGAYTGEISPLMLRDLGCEYVIIGHSERRKYFSCSDEDVNKRLKAAARADLKPIVCIGETLKEREEGSTFDVLGRQLKFGLKDLFDREKEFLSIAYEPIWAIGTGKTATPAIAAEAHKFIREKITEMYGAPFADDIRIIYGGSVKPGNISSLMSEQNIDGALVGGASLEADSFSALFDF
ncbi:MAG: triose-phosphate isomerase [Elusimicrobiota bacterium]